MPLNSTKMGFFEWQGVKFSKTVLLFQNFACFKILLFQKFAVSIFVFKIGSVFCVGSAGSIYLIDVHEPTKFFTFFENQHPSSKNF